MKGREREEEVAREIRRKFYQRSVKLETGVEVSYRQATRNPDSHGTMHTRSLARSLKMVGFWSEAAVFRGVLEAGGVVTRGPRVNDHPHTGMDRHVCWGPAL